MKTTMKLITGLFIFLFLVLPVTAVERFEIEETDYIKVTADAIDLDMDILNITYSEPLSPQGDWLTGYDDAGEYFVTITASDGKETATKTIAIVVHNRNQPPTIKQNTLIAHEQERIDLKQLVDDPDEDILRYSFSAPFNEEGIWEPSYNDAGEYVVDFTIDDGEAVVSKRVALTVLNTNQPPVITDVFSNQALLTAEEGETVEFFVEAEDKDQQPITYIWQLDNTIISREDRGEIDFDYKSAGDHLLRVTINDNETTTTQEWQFTVKNTNRAPEISHNPIVVNEGEKVEFTFPKTDIDGDVLAYTFSEPVNLMGGWQTDFEDAGEYSIRVTASDGKLEDTIRVPVTVLDVDRAPSLLQLPKKISVREGEEISFQVNAEDPDGDSVNITITNAPETATLSKTNEFRWAPDYNFIQRSGGWWSNLANRLGIEHLLLKRRTIPLEVTACGKEECQQEKVYLMVYNTNRPPVLDHLDPITVNETATIQLSPSAIDPDGDIVHYQFSKPFNKHTGEWVTDFTDEGEYVVTVTASDRSAKTMQDVPVTILRTNQPPRLEVNHEQVNVDEGEEFTLHLKATDPDHDELNVSLNYLPSGASFSDNTFVWEPNFATVQNPNSTDKEAMTTQWLEFQVSDGNSEVIVPVKVNINNVNQQPEVIDFLPDKTVTVAPYTPIVFHVAARDNDNDFLTYTWDFGFGEDSQTGPATMERTFVSAGEKTVGVTVSDGEKTVRHEWEVYVPETAQPVEQPIPTNDPFSVRVYVIQHGGEQ